MTSIHFIIEGIDTIYFVAFHIHTELFNTYLPTLLWFVTRFFQLYLMAVVIVVQ